MGSEAVALAYMRCILLWHIYLVRTCSTINMAHLEDKHELSRSDGIRLCANVLQDPNQRPTKCPRRVVLNLARQKTREMTANNRIEAVIRRNFS